MDRIIRTWQVPALAVLLLCSGLRALLAQHPEIPGPVPATENTAALAAHTQPAPALHWSWTEADHPSGIYHAKSPAHLTLLLDNTSAEALPVAGQILFGTHDPATAAGTGAPPPPETFKTLSITPVAPVTLQPGQRARIPLALTFAAAGSYELRFAAGNDQTPIRSAAGIPLECIFAPRTLPDDSPWLMLLPHAAVEVPGLLTDLAAQTSARRFLIDEHFAFDPAANLGLSFGASLEAAAPEVNTLLTEAAKAKLSLVLRVSIPPDADPRTIAAFRQYLADAVQRARGTLRAVVIAPDPNAHFDPAAFRALYLAAYETIKRADKTILMLGAGSAPATEQLLLAQHLDAYVDALAVTDTVAQPALLKILNASAVTLPGEKKPISQRPLWILPPPISDPWSLLPPAAALAQGASVIPLPPSCIDRGVTAHLLGGAVFFQSVTLANATAESADPTTPGFTSDLPFIAVFQGDGYAVAAIAGDSAGTPLDARFPALARNRTAVEPVPAPPPDEQPPYPNLEIGDDTRTMRVVDHQGSAVDCRIGDQLYIPATESVMYLLQAGPADDLTGSIRSGNTHRLPLFEISGRSTPAGALALHLRNVTPKELTGRLRLVAPAAPGSAAQVLVEKAITPLAPGASCELPLEFAGTPAAPLIVEISTANALQRTALTPEPAEPSPATP